MSSRFQLFTFSLLTSTLAACTLNVAALPGTKVLPGARTGATATASPAKQASALPTASPGSVSCVPAPVASPVSGNNGRAVYAASVAGYAAVPGLAVANGRPQAREVSVYLATAPGSSEIRVLAVDVVLNYTQNGTQATLGPVRVPILPVVLPAPAKGFNGQAEKLVVPLPTTALSVALADASAPLTNLSASLEFIEDDGFAIQNSNMENIQASLPLALDATVTPASPVVSGTCTAPAPSYAPAQPVVTDDGIPPKTVNWAGLAPTILTLKPDGTLDASEVVAQLSAPAGGASTTISAFDIVYTFNTQARQAAGEPVQQIGPARVPLATPLVVPAGSADKVGPAVSVSIPLAGTGGLLPAAADAGLVVTLIEPIDDKGFPVQDAKFQNLQLSVPILVQ